MAAIGIPHPPPAAFPSELKKILQNILKTSRLRALSRYPRNDRQIPISCTEADS